VNTDPLEGTEERQCQKSSFSFALKFEQTSMIAAKKVCDPGRSSVPDRSPDHLRRSSSEEAALARVVVLRNQGEAAVPCVVADALVLGTAKSDVATCALSG